MDVVRAEIAALGGRVEVTTPRGPRHDIPPLSAADAGGGAGGARARRRQAVGAALADGRAGAADQGRSARQPVRRAQGRVAGQELSVPLPAAAPGRSAPQSGDGALQPGAAAARRAERRRDPRRRNDRQPGSRGEEHRAAARPRIRHCRRDGARQRRDRADHQPGAARAAARTCRSTTRTRSGWRRCCRRWRRRRRRAAAGTAARDDRRRLADRAQDHEPHVDARRAST